MKTIYYLTKIQYFKLWRSLSDDGGMIESNTETALMIRINIWDKTFKEQYHLSYNEELCSVENGLYGIIAGEEKYINWFLLNL